MTALLCCLVFAVAQDPPPAAWKTITFAEGGFSVRLPAQPREEKKTFKGTQGPIEVTMLLVDIKKGGTLGVAYSQPPMAPKELTPEMRLAHAVKEVVAITKGKLLKETPIKLGDHLGRELEIEVEGKGTVRTRLYALPRRFYQVLAIGDRQWVESPDVQKFFESFAVSR